jgi:hypothetical protein
MNAPMGTKSIRPTRTQEEIRTFFELDIQKKEFALSWLHRASTEFACVAYYVRTCICNHVRVWIKGPSLGLIDSTEVKNTMLMCPTQNYLKRRSFPKRLKIFSENEFSLTGKCKLTIRYSIYPLL